MSMGRGLRVVLEVSPKYRQGKTAYTMANHAKETEIAAAKCALVIGLANALTRNILST